ncbi:MAG: paraquat-inducible protein A, partial [Pseudomonadales bacterium]|nr:paraquat-inducible protein A [Pseudomonadales bacterium]
MTQQQSSINILTMIAIGCSAILIVTGLVTPAFRLDTLGEAPSDVSILVGAWDSLDSKDAWIGVVVILFSAVFPALKLWGLTHIVRHTHPGDARALIWLELLGKWS